MSRLQISLLGSFRVLLDGKSVVGFRSDKVRALLAYLATEREREHPREVLASLLWPELTEPEALANLRYSLSNLRQVIGDRSASVPFLLITRDTLQFNPASDHTLDVRAFDGQIALGEPDALASAVSLYQGPFLEGFSLADAAPFEEWALLKREQLARQLWLGLGRLADAYEVLGEYGVAEGYARRRVELEPLEEEGQRQLMRVLARGGQRSAALQQYQAFVRLLKDELGAEPEAETTALYRQIQLGELRPQPARGPRAERTGEREAAVPAVEPETPASAAISPAAPPAHRRLVSVLCCQVEARAGAGPLDLEETAAITAAARELVAGAVVRHQGTLMASSPQVLALFGVGAAREDDPERAVQTALEVTASTEPRGDFSVRIGISTGLLLVEQSGTGPASEASAYRATGDAVTLAMLLAGHAPELGILMGPDTYRHLRGLFDIRAHPPMQLQGRTAPLQCYRVLRARPHSFRRDIRGVEGVETRMVGRELELQELQQAYQDVLVGAETRVVTVVGEAGVGKSRLLYEFEDWLELRGEPQTFFKGRASAATQGVPFSLVRDLFAQRFEILESDPNVEVLAKFRRGMAGLLPPQQADLVGQLAGFDFTAAGSPVARGRLGRDDFGRVAGYHLVEYFRALLARQPVTVLAEDLHWADDASLDLLARLAARLAASRFLILATARPEFYERRPNWGEGEPAYSRVEVRPLSRRASGELADEILQKVPQVPEQLREMLVVEAEGNPFYLEELVKMLVEDGAIVVGEEQWQVIPERLAGMRLPSTLAEVLQARLDVLSVEERTVLQRAAVVGRAFWDTALIELLPGVMRGGSVHAVLQRLRARELIFRRERSVLEGSSEYVFKHALLKDAVYDTVLLEERRQCHKQVAVWLEQQAGERVGERLSLIATHYRKAGEVAKAIAYLQRAGEEAFKLGAFRDARSAFEAGLALMDHAGGVGDAGSPGVRARLLIGLGQVMRHLAGFREASQMLDAGRALAREAGDRRSEVIATLWLSYSVAHLADYPRAQALLEEAMALARGCGDQESVGLAMSLLSMVLSGQGKYEQAVHWGEAGLAFCRSRDDWYGIEGALNGLLLACLLRPSEYERGHALGLEGLALSREAGNPWAQALFQDNLGWLAFLEGHHEEARNLASRGHASAEQAGDRVEAADSRMLEACLCLAERDDQGAWAYLRRSLQEVLAIHSLAFTGIIGVALAAQLYILMGLHTRAAELAGLALSPPGPVSSWLAEGALSALRQVLSPDELEAALARGRALDLEQTVVEILAKVDERATPGTSQG